MRCEVPECGHETLEGTKAEGIDMLKIHLLSKHGLQIHGANVDREVSDNDLEVDFPGPQG